MSLHQVLDIAGYVVDAILIGQAAFAGIVGVVIYKAYRNDSNNATCKRQGVHHE